MADSNWQKVKVAFDDADGNRVEAVMWWVKDALRVWRSTDPSDGFGFHIDSEGVTATPIRELPTGVGAVIRVTDYGRNALQQSTPGRYGDMWMLYEDGWRYRGPHRGDPFKPSEIAADDWQYEVLSEGIQIGGVR